MVNWNVLQEVNGIRGYELFMMYVDMRYELRTCSKLNYKRNMYRCGLEIWIMNAEWGTIFQGNAKNRTIIAVRVCVCVM